MTDETKLHTGYPVGQWIGWNGGPCPVHQNDKVDRRMPDGQLVKGCFAGWLSWVAPCLFRIVTPYVEPKKPREVWAVYYESGKFYTATFSEFEAIRIAKIVSGSQVVRMVEADQ